MVLPPSKKQLGLRRKHRLLLAVALLLCCLLSSASSLLNNFFFFCRSSCCHVSSAFISSSTHQRQRHHHNLSTTKENTDAAAYPDTKEDTNNNANSYNWAEYSLRQSYKKSGGILYKQSLLTPTEFTTVQNEINNLISNNELKLVDEKETSFATNRIGAVLDRNSDVYKIFSCDEGSICRLVNTLVDNDNDDDAESEANDLLLGNKMILSPDIPIEIRIYEKNGAGMEWHVDDIIYTNTKQVEVVFTLENTSDCCTMWKPHDQLILQSLSVGDDRRGDNDDGNSSNNNKYRIESVQTTPNSAILIKAGSVEHKVSSLSYGRRVILKMAFVREGASMSDEMREHVSHHDVRSGAGGVKKIVRKGISTTVGLPGKKRRRR
jgi:hypothetical protein